MKLTIYNQTKLQLGEIEFVKDLKNQTKIKYITDQNDVKMGIAKVLIEASTLIGIKHAITELDKVDLVELILMRFKHLSLEEVSYAFKLERYGVYDDKTDHFHHFNADYVSRILEKYQKHRTKLIFERKLNQEKKEMTLSEEEKLRLNNSAVLKVIDLFIERRIIDRSRIYVYETLDELGYLKISIEDKWKIFEQAKKDVKYELENKKLGAGFDEAHKIKRQIESISKGGSMVIQKAKELSLHQFFMELKRKGELEQFRTKFEI